MTQAPPPFSMTSWLLTSLRRFVMRSIVVIGGLQAFNYLFGGDDDWKAWAAASRAEIAIGLLVCAIANLMYDWLRSHEP